MSSPVIVIIDNDEDHLCYLTSLLRRAGYDCAAFPHVRAAMKYIVENDVALVITEVVMPELDGIEVLRAVKLSFPDVPVVAVCGTRQGDLYLHLMQQFGASATFAKPIAAPAVLGAVEQWVDRQSPESSGRELPIEDLVETGLFSKTEQGRLKC